MRGQAEAHRVDQAVLLVGRLEVDLAADGGHADRVAVVADAGDGVLEQVARALGVGGLAEAQRVEHRDRPRADREHVAQDPADPGGRALEGLDRARVVVRLDLEGDAEPAADVDHAGVLARAHEHVRALGGQPAQQLLGVLVGAVLGPHQREHRQLDVAGLAAEALDDQLVLGVGEPELRGGDGRVRRATRSVDSARGMRRRRSPARRSTRSAGRRRARGGASGRTRCRPRCTRRRCRRSEPLGFWPGGVAQQHLAGRSSRSSCSAARSSGRSCA